MLHPPLFTIGYGAREIADFLSVLESENIAYLIDVRSRPYSRFKPDFSKERLEAHVETHGIRYVYMGDQLGGMPDDPDCYIDGKVEYDRIREKAFYQAGIERLRKAYGQGLRVAIMCSEGKPEQCHRSKLIGVTLEQAGIPVAHIDENDRLIGQEDVLLRLNQGQLTLFGSELERFTSRKRYQSGEHEEEQTE